MAAALIKTTNAKTKQNQNKRDVRERQHDVRPEDTNSHHLWLINRGKRTSTTNTLALGYPLLGPSRHVRAYYCMPQSSPGFLCSDQFCHEMSCPLFRRPASSPLILGCSRPLVGVDTESSGVVQETPHPLFLLSPHTARAPYHFSKHHVLRQSRILHARHEPREQDPPLAYSRPDAPTSYLDKLGCPDRKSGYRRDCSFINRSSESGSCGGLGAAHRSGTRAGST